METQNQDTQLLEVPPSTKEYIHTTPPTAVEIQIWVVNYLAELLEIEPDELDVTISFDHYGLDSGAAVGLTGDLEDWLGRRLDPTLLYDYPTVESFSKHLAEELQVKA
ncbi:MAG: acyl carrier protein [Nostocaceae cyanobacterium]|nr:acyl carrier protein [Nostocaceae cyanobacterium]